MATEFQHPGLTQPERAGQLTTEQPYEHSHHGSSNALVHAGGEETGQWHSPVAVGTHHHVQESLFSRVRHFVLHYLEMCLAMCIGGITLNVLFFTGVAQLGYTNLTERYPEFSILMIGILLAIPMAAWMRFRGHEWRPNLEMSSTSILLALLLITAAWLGIIPQSAMLEWIKRLACPVMLIPMLFRLDLYTGHHTAHSRHAVQEPTGA